MEKEGWERRRLRGMEKVSEERVDVKIPEGLVPEGIEGTCCPMICLVKTVNRNGAIRVVKSSVEGAEPREGASIIGNIRIT